MKITYINKGSISEGFIKTVDKMKDGYEQNPPARETYERPGNPADVEK